MGKNGLDAIVEYKDATPEQLKIGLCNSGAMCINGRCLYDLLKQIDNNNAAGEYYLPDIVKVAKKQGLKVDVGMADADEVAGANSRQELSLVEAVFQKRMRKKAFDSGVTMQDPNSVYFSYDTTFENDVFIEPCVSFGPNVHIRKGARVPAFTRVENKIIERK